MTIRTSMYRDDVRALVNVDLPSVSKTKVIGILTQTVAILKGHFSFQGTHSQHFLCFNHIGRIDRHCRYLAKLLIKQARIDLDDERPLKVLSPESAGFLLGISVVRLLDNNSHKNLVIAPVDMFRKPYIGGSLRSGEINPGDRVVVVNDVDRTGESLDQLIRLARRKGATVDTAMVFAACNEGEYLRRMIDMGVTPYRLVEFKLETYKKENCPLCPVDKDLLPAVEFT